MDSAPLKIVYAVDAWGHEYAGGLRSAHRMVELLRQRHQVRVIGVGEPCEGLQCLPPLKIPFASGILARNQFTFARPDPAVVARALDGADLLHVQLPFWLGYRAMAMAKARGIPVIASHHVQPENLLLNVGIKWAWLAGALNRVLVRTFFNRADRVVCPSEFSQRELQRFGLRAPSQVISNGAPAVYEPAADREPRMGELTLLTVGRMANEKRQDLVIDAVLLSKHRDRLNLVIAGKGPLETRLRQRVAPLGARARVGFVPDAELLALYQTSDLYVHASEVELEGMAVLEAARCGCPALISDAPESASTQFALGPQLLFAAGDARSLAEKIDYWFEHPEQLSAARAQTLAQAASFGIDHSVEQLERLYHQVVANRPVAPPLPVRSVPRLGEREAWR